MISADHPGDGRARHSKAPVIETERLILRGFEPADFSAYHATMTNPDVMRHLGEPLSREEAYRRMAMFCGLWMLQGVGMWAVELKTGGPIVGQVGLFDLRRDMQPSLEGELEMGWIFDPVAHGQGLASEAGRAVLDWVDREFAPATIPAIIAPANAPSMRLAERLGFVREADGVYKNEPIAVFRRDRAG